MADVCETCRFGTYSERRTYRDGPSIECSPAKVRCRRFPHAIEKKPEDWCGEYLPPLPTQSGQE